MSLREQLLEEIRKGDCISAVPSFVAINCISFSKVEFGKSSAVIVQLAFFFPAATAEGLGTFMFAMIRLCLQWFQQLVMMTFSRPHETTEPEAGGKLGKKLSDINTCLDLAHQQHIIPHTTSPLLEEIKANFYSTSIWLP